MCVTRKHPEHSQSINHSPRSIQLPCVVDPYIPWSSVCDTSGIQCSACLHTPCLNVYKPCMLHARVSVFLSFSLINAFHRSQVEGSRILLLICEFVCLVGPKRIDMMVNDKQDATSSQAQDTLNRMLPGPLFFWLRCERRRQRNAPLGFIDMGGTEDRYWQCGEPRRLLIAKSPQYQVKYEK